MNTPEEKAVIGTSKMTLLLVVIAAAAFSSAAVIGLYALQKNTPQRPQDPEVYRGENVPVMFQLPDFELTERSGKPFGSEDLEGKVWIAQFVFTRCMGPCPMITARTSTLQDILKQHSQWERMRLVSFSVDPEHDTPEVLRGYADLANADPEHWLFLTGERNVIWPLVEQGFKLLVADQPEDTAMPIAHSTRHVLVDTQGRIRGYYDALNNDGRAALLRDLDLVLSETRASVTEPNP